MIRMPAAGSTDDATARAPGIPIRTMRRMVTGTMGKIGAVSRFQAGVRASALGLPDGTVGQIFQQGPENRLSAAA